MLEQLIANDVNKQFPSEQNNQGLIKEQKG